MFVLYLQMYIFAFDLYIYTYMEQRSQRLSDIKKIIQTEQVSSQDNLLKNLISKGYHITQATLSRDLKLLKVAKMPDASGIYRYVLPQNIEQHDIISSSDKTSVDGFLSIEFSGNIGVINTIPAFSHTIASAIDNANMESIAGTLAGNDTIIFVIREDHNPNNVRKELSKKFPDLVNKLL